MTQDWEGGTLEESGKLENPDYRCRHGVFIGDPYGPDYMCHYCEMGITDEEYEAELAWENKMAKRRIWYKKYCERMMEALKSGAMDADEASRRLKRLYKFARVYRSW